jgi:hypothetical protein
MRSCSRIRKTPKFGIRIAERLQVRPMGSLGFSGHPRVLCRLSPPAGVRIAAEPSLDASFVFSSLIAEYFLTEDRGEVEVPSPFPCHLATTQDWRLERPGVACGQYRDREHTRHRCARCPPNGEDRRR